LCRISFDGSEDSTVSIHDPIFASPIGEEIPDVETGYPVYFDIPPFMIMGDYNSSGEINAADILAVVNLIVQEEEPSAYDLYIADLNNDYNIDILDIMLLVNLILESF